MLDHPQHGREEARDVAGVELAIGVVLEVDGLVAVEPVAVETKRAERAERANDDTTS